MARLRRVSAHSFGSAGGKTVVADAADIFRPGFREYVDTCEVMTDVPTLDYIAQAGNRAVGTSEMDG